MDPGLPPWRLDVVLLLLPPLLFPLVVVGLGLVPCGEAECSRKNGTPTATIPATIIAIAASLRLLGIFIFLCSISLFSWVRAAVWAGYIIQRIDQE